MPEIRERVYRFADVYREHVLVDPASPINSEFRSSMADCRAFSSSALNNVVDEPDMLEMSRASSKFEGDSASVGTNSIDIERSIQIFCNNLLGIPDNPTRTCGEPDNTFIHHEDRPDLRIDLSKFELQARGLTESAFLDPERRAVHLTSASIGSGECTSTLCDGSSHCAEHLSLSLERAKQQCEPWLEHLDCLVASVGMDDQRILTPAFRSNLEVFRRQLVLDSESVLQMKSASEMREILRSILNTIKGVEDLCASLRQAQHPSRKLYANQLQIMSQWCQHLRAAGFVVER